MSQFETDVTTLLVAIAEGQLLLLDQLGHFEHREEFFKPVEQHRDEFEKQIKAIHARLLQHRLDQEQRQVPSDRNPLTSI